MAKQGKAWHAEVLEIIQRSDSPMSAYDVLAELRGAHPKMAPPTVYRALAALADQHAIHRLESMNAYVACQGEEHTHDVVLSICDDCGTVEESESPEVMSSLTSVVGQSGFSPKKHVIEVHGSCRDCSAGQVT